MLDTFISVIVFLAILFGFIGFFLLYHYYVHKILQSLGAKLNDEHMTESRKKTWRQGVMPMATGLAVAIAIMVIAAND